MTEHFGKLESEAMLEENVACREIVKEIMNFGVDQRQILFIVRLLALELDNLDHCREIIGAVDSFNENILISNMADS